MTDEPVGYVRGTRQKEWQERMRAKQPPGIRVVPANDAMRRLLKHPSRGAFPRTGGVEWPNDKYTKRRLADGSVTREEEAAETSERSSRSKSTAAPDRSADRATALDR